MPGGFLPSTSSLETPIASREAVSEQELTPLEADERAFEQLQEQERTEAFLEEDIPITSGAVPQVQTMPAAASATTTNVQKDEAVLQVEKILEDGLGDFVLTMPDAPKARFLQLGQQLAAQLATMVRNYKVKVREVMHLIREWLLVIPGVNSYFLEQEAKIKTDRILAYEQIYHDAHLTTT